NIWYRPTDVPVTATVVVHAALLAAHSRAHTVGTVSPKTQIVLLNISPLLVRAHSPLKACCCVCCCWFLSLFVGVYGCCLFQIATKHCGKTASGGRFTGGRRAPRRDTAKALASLCFRSTRHD